MDWRRDAFRVTDRRETLDVAVIHDFLGKSYWARGIPRELLEKSIENSLCFGVFHDEGQVSVAQAGFCRVVTDRATFAYLADVFILDTYRGRGLGKWLVECVLGHPELQGLRRWILATRDAHGLYAQHGFLPVNNPERLMEMVDPDVYLRQS